MLLLSVESESGAVLTYRLQKPQITVGSSSKNDVVVRVPGVGDRHLVIYNSSNGLTFVTVDRQTVVLNGERRSRGVLSPGDRLRLGGSTLVLQTAEDVGERQSALQTVNESAPTRVPRPAPDTFSVVSDSVGLSQPRAMLFDLFLDPPSDLLHRLVAVLRAELFGPLGYPSKERDDSGVVGRARGGVLVLRNVEALGKAVQEDLASFIASELREPLSASSLRWIITCGEDPLALVQQGKLATNLFMIFSKRMLRVPRLSERREDLPLLIASLMRRAAAEQDKTTRGISLECLNALLSKNYAGELGELVGEVNRLVTATPDGEMVRCSGLDLHAASASAAAGGVSQDLIDVLASDNLKQVVPRVEQLLIDRVMRKVKGNQSKGARILGISRGALIAKLKEYGVPDYRYLRRRRQGMA